MAYAAPEQLAPEAACDCRADIYSLGILLHEMLTGERPGNDSSKWQKSRGIVFDKLLDISSSCTRFKPGDRYQRVEEVKEELIICRNKYISQKENHKIKRKTVIFAVGLLSLINYTCLLLGLLYGG